MDRLGEIFVYLNISIELAHLGITVESFVPTKFFTLLTICKTCNTTATNCTNKNMDMKFGTNSSGAQ